MFCYVRKKVHLSVFAITERRDMGLYEVPLFVSLLGFEMRTMLDNFHMCGIMLVKSSFQHAREKWESKRAYVFSCLMFSLSEPCELLFLLLFYCLLNLSCGECDVISLYFMCFSVNGSVCFVCCVFDSVCELFGETTLNMFGCGCYFIVECYGSV